MAERKKCYNLNLQLAIKEEVTHQILQSQNKSKAIWRIIHQERTANRGKKVVQPMKIVIDGKVLHKPNVINCRGN